MQKSTKRCKKSESDAKITADAQKVSKRLKSPEPRNENRHLRCKSFHKYANYLTTNQISTTKIQLCFLFSYPNYPVTKTFLIKGQKKKDFVEKHRNYPILIEGVEKNKKT